MSHQDRREPLPKDYRFGDAGLETKHELALLKMRKAEIFANYVIAGEPIRLDSLLIDPGANYIPRMGD